MEGGSRNDYASNPSSPSPRAMEDTLLLDPMSPKSPSPPGGSSLSSKPSRTVSTASFISSPLNPTSPPINAPVQNPFASTRSRPASRASGMDLNSSHFRESAYPTSPSFPTGFGMAGGGGNRGSMVLYRLATDDDNIPSGMRTPGSFNRESGLLLPPKFPGNYRDSTISSSGSSIASLDSKYPLSNRDSAFPTAPRGFVPYEYDPALDLLDPVDEEDKLHDPKEHGNRGNRFPWRGVVNIFMLLALVLALLCLFILYPVITFYRNEARNAKIDGNVRINGTGQAPVLFQMPDLIDKDTPDDAKTRTGYDNKEYELVFSDEFTTPGRTFYPGDDPFWEAVDLWYGATADQEWYDPSQVTTRDGKLVITMDSTETTQAGLTPNSTAPFTADENHQLQYRSGMLQSWNKFCFTSGYIEVSVVLPGPNENTQGYWPGAWTMGNLARPGYPATTDGMWPYTYNTCDIGTFPNQTLADDSGPPAALHSDASRDKYNYELSWLSGQRLSACSCPNSDHPGPTPSKGRGAPEIDIFEAEKDKDAPTGHVVSQSAQFAPFSHDYVYLDDTSDEWFINDPTITRANSYRGSAVQQAVSGLTKLPSDMFQGSNPQRFVTLAFEYWANPDNVDEGYIAWMVDGKQTSRVGAKAVPPDPLPLGSGVGQRLIPEEPMSIVLNLGISSNWQNIDLSTMQFPAEFLIDYVRVYQRKGSTNIGCDPKDYPTANYISSHLEAYQNINLTTWPWDKPKNQLLAGNCD